MAEAASGGAKRFRVHCWIDVSASDEEMARTSASISLLALARDPSVLRFAIAGTPVDLAAHQRKSIRTR